MPPTEKPQNPEAVGRLAGSQPQERRPRPHSWEPALGLSLVAHLHRNNARDHTRGRAERHSNSSQPAAIRNTGVQERASRSFGTPLPWAAMS